jgi:hypothetical protein
MNTTFDSLSYLRQSSGLGKFSELIAAFARKIRPKGKTDSVWIPIYSKTHRREMAHFKWEGKARGSKNRKRQPFGEISSFLPNTSLKKTDRKCEMEFQLQGSKFCLIFNLF